MEFMLWKETTQRIATILILLSRNPYNAWNELPCTHFLFTLLFRIKYMTGNLQEQKLKSIIPSLAKCYITYQQRLAARKTLRIYSVIATYNLQVTHTLVMYTCSLNLQTISTSGHTFHHVFQISYSAVLFSYFYNVYVTFYDDICGQRSSISAYTSDQKYALTVIL